MGRPSSADTASHVSGRTGERTETKGTGTTRPPQATVSFTQSDQPKHVRRAGIVGVLIMGNIGITTIHYTTCSAVVKHT